MRTDHGSGMSGSGRSLRRWRAATFLAAGVAVGVAMTATPVLGHIGSSVSHLWNAHLKAKTDARYYTKAQANARYLQAAGTAADAELLDGLDSAAFLRSDAKAADAELLDGLDSTAFLPVAGTAANSELLDGLDSAAFLRASGKAADAELLDGLDPAAFLRASGKAADAELLDGLDSAAFLRASGKAADAEQLDGRDSTAFVHGDGEAVGAAITVPQRANTGVWNVLDVPGFLNVAATCSSPGTATVGFFRLINKSSEVMDVFLESGGDNPDYHQLDPDRFVEASARVEGDSFHVQIHAGSTVATLEGAYVRRESDCHIQVQLVVTR
jgi:hypothetical protein